MVSVTVVMPANNAEATVLKAIESVRNQTFRNWELIVTNDGSTDGTAELCESAAASDARIRVLHSSTSEGAARARNRAIDRAAGRFIAFLDADDLWRPQKLLRQLQFMAETGAALTYTAYSVVGAEYEGNGAEIEIPGAVVSARPVATYASLSRHDYIGCLTAVYDRDKTGTVLMPDLRKRQDYALWLKILREKNSGAGLNEVLAIYRRGGVNSLSGNKLKTIPYTWKVHRQFEGRSRIQSLGNVTSHIGLSAAKHAGIAARSIYRRTTRHDR